MSVPFEVGGFTATVVSLGAGNVRAIEVVIPYVPGVPRMSGKAAHDLITALALALHALEVDSLGVCRGCALRRVAPPCFGTREDGFPCYRRPLVSDE